MMFTREKHRGRVRDLTFKVQRLTIVTLLTIVELRKLREFHGSRFNVQRSYYFQINVER